jgi:hypothetical protein
MTALIGRSHFAEDLGCSFIMYAISVLVCVRLPKQKIRICTKIIIRVRKAEVPSSKNNMNLRNAKQRMQLARGGRGEGYAGGAGQRV